VGELQDMAHEADFVAGPDRMRTTWFGTRHAEGVDLMALHGIGSTANRLGGQYLMDGLADLGLSSASFDFPGHGDSPGDAMTATLQDRVQQADAMAGILKPRALFGVSMGAFAALRIAAKVQPSALILFCPALYPAASMDRALDKGFVASLGQGDWFRTSPLLQDIRRFAGDLLIVGGRDDTVTPPESFQVLHDAATAARSRALIWLDGCGHAIHPHLRGRSALQATLTKRIAHLLLPQNTHAIQEEV